MQRIKNISGFFLQDIPYRHCRNQNFKDETRYSVPAQILGFCFTQPLSSRKVIGQEVERVCKAEHLAILQDLLPHITALMDRAVRQESSVRVVTHGDFHQWNMAFDSENLFYDCDQSKL